MRRSRPRSSARTCGIFAGCSTTTTTRPRFTATSVTAAFTCRSASISRPRRASASTTSSSSARADLVVSYGGSLSGEHGDGQSRGALLPKMFGPELMRAFAEFKAVWDPDNRMNPHKLDRRIPADREPAAGRRLQPGAAGDLFSVSRRQGLIRQGSIALHRPGRVPQARLRDDVPELHGDARRAAQHARPRADAVGTAPGRGAARLLEERRGQARAGSVPLLQGVQVGVPDERRHRDLPVGVSLALLRARTGVLSTRMPSA